MSKKIKGVFNLIHEFANGATSGECEPYEIENDKLYRNDTLICIKYDRIIFIKNEITKSAFGNGVTSYDVKGAFSNNKLIYAIVDNVYFYLNLNIQEYAKYLINSNYIGNIIDCVKNNKRQITYNMYDRYYNDVVLPYKKLKQILTKKELESIKSLNKITNLSYYYYKGWTGCYKNIEINTTYLNILSGKLLNSKEKNIYNAKRFWYLYAKEVWSSLPKLKDKLEVYNDIIIRNKIVKLKISKDIKDNKHHNSNVFCNNIIDLKLKNYFNKVKQWKSDNNNIRYLSHPYLIKNNNNDVRLEWTNFKNILKYKIDYSNVILIPNELKIIKNRLITSSGVILNLNDNTINIINNIIKLFKQYCNTKSKKVRSNLINKFNSIAIKNYRVNFIGHDFIFNNDYKEYYIKIGCHLFNEQTINDFSKEYNTLFG